MNVVESKSDEQLLAEHISGAPGAFDLLVQRYTHEVFGFVCRFVSDKATAEDLVQDTFVQVHLAAQSFDPTRKFRPWLYTIAANKARDYLRSRGRRPHYSLDTVGSDPDGPTPAQNLEAEGQSLTEQVEERERKQVVRALVDQMPEHLKLILTLGYFQQLPYAEIAEVLEIPIGTVKSRLHAAVGHFAKLWKQQTETGSPVEP